MTDANAEPLQCYFTRGGTELGPYSIDEIRALLEGGTLSLDDKIRTSLGDEFEAGFAPCIESVDGRVVVPEEWRPKKTSGRKRKPPEFHAWKDILLTTSHSLETHRITEYIDIIAADVVYGVSILKDIFTAVTDLTGGRSKAAEETLSEAREVCFKVLRQRASHRGANALIGVTLSYNEMSGKGKSMLMVAAAGTAVKIEPHRDAPQ